MSLDTDAIAARLATFGPQSGLGESAAIAGDIAALLAEVATLREALGWALDYIADGDDETPSHVCEFASNPLKGACDFHERYWAAREALRVSRLTEEPKP